MIWIGESLLSVSSVARLGGWLVDLRHGGWWWVVEYNAVGLSDG